MYLVGFFLGAVISFGLAYFYIRYPMATLGRVLHHTVGIFISDTVTRGIAYLLGALASAAGLVFIILFAIGLAHVLYG